MIYLYGAFLKTKVEELGCEFDAKAKGFKVKARKDEVKDA
jgi:hypothetical protein